MIIILSDKYERWVKFESTHSWSPKPKRRIVRTHVVKQGSICLLSLIILFIYISSNVGIKIGILDKI